MWSWLKPSSTAGTTCVCVWVCWTEELASLQPFSKASRSIPSPGKAFGFSFWRYFSQKFFFFFKFQQDNRVHFFSTAWLMPRLLPPFALSSGSLCVAEAQKRLPLYSEMARPFLSQMLTLEVLTFRSGLPLSHRFGSRPVWRGSSALGPVVAVHKEGFFTAGLSPKGMSWHGWLARGHENKLLFSQIRGATVKIKWIITASTVLTQQGLCQTWATRIG